MNAKEARKAAEDNIKNSSNKFRMDIDERIGKAVKDKKFEINIYSVPCQEERIILKKFYCDLGYTWKHISGDQFTNSTIKISW